jgi:hypothetical protein
MPYMYRCGDFPEMKSRPVRSRPKRRGAWRMLSIGARLVAVLIVLGIAGCSESSVEGTCKPSGTVLRIATEESHTFNTDCLAAPADRAFTIEYRNDDNSAHGNHNIHIHNGGTLFKGDVARYGTSITYSVPPLPAGDYRFRCDEHTFMSGDFNVE